MTWRPDWLAVVEWPAQKQEVVEMMRRGRPTQSGIMHADQRHRLAEHSGFLEGFSYGARSRGFADLQQTAH